jgi:hypothetical protein
MGAWRYAMWVALAAALICPLVAMQFTNEVRWDSADFAAAAVLLAGLGAAVELAFGLSKRSRTGAVAIGMSLMTFMLIWADAAVGVF